MAEVHIINALDHWNLETKVLQEKRKLLTLEERVRTLSLTLEEKVAKIEKSFEALELTQLRTDSCSLTLEKNLVEEKKPELFNWKAFYFDLLSTVLKDERIGKIILDGESGDFHLKINVNLITESRLMKVEMMKLYQDYQKEQSKKIKF
jgi:hypothetical protein